MISRTSRLASLGYSAVAAKVNGQVVRRAGSRFTRERRLGYPPAQPWG